MHGIARQLAAAMLGARRVAREFLEDLTNVIEIKSPEEIEKMRATSRLAASVLDFIRPHVVPGVTTGELDKLCHDYMVEHGATPATLNYKGSGPVPFPASICTSVNEVVCHGIPGKQRLREGDILNIDVTTILDGFHGDTSEMFFVGEVSDEARRLVEVTREAMWRGIMEVGPGKRVGDIGAAIYEFAHLEHGYGVVWEFNGHGIGRTFHALPVIKHAAPRNTGVRMRPGMTFTVEPMINLGVAETEILADGWTAVTKDRRLSAQTEHTVLVTETGFEVLTMRDGAWCPPQLRRAG